MGRILEPQSTPRPQRIKSSAVSIGIFSDSREDAQKTHNDFVNLVLFRGCKFRVRLWSLSLPAKLVEFFFGANEFDGAVVEQDAAAFGVVVIKCEQLRPAVLIPARLRLEKKNRVWW